MAAAALSPQNLRYPQSQGEYQAVVLEVDNQKLLERIAAAETAILVRVQAFAKCRWHAVNVRPLTTR
jgi:hypothetical protein